MQYQVCVLLSDYIFISSLRFTSTWTPSLYRAPRKSIGIFGAGMSRDTFLAGKEFSMIIEKFLKVRMTLEMTKYLNKYFCKCLSNQLCKYKYLIPESQDDIGEDQHIHQEPSAWKKKRTRQTWIEKRKSNKIFAHYVKENKKRNSTKAKTESVQPKQNLFLRSL